MSETFTSVDEVYLEVDNGFISFIAFYLDEVPFLQLADTELLSNSWEQL